MLRSLLKDLVPDEDIQQVQMSSCLYKGVHEHSTIEFMFSKTSDWVQHFEFIFS